jgi:hypothetical protein
MHNECGHGVKKIYKYAKEIEYFYDRKIEMMNGGVESSIVKTEKGVFVFGDDGLFGNGILKLEYEWERKIKKISYHVDFSVLLV